MANENQARENTEEEKNHAVPQQHLAAEYLANERTFLAWIRTSIAVISLGFVIAKFGLWLSELAIANKQFERIRTGASVPVGVAMIFLGGILCVLAAWRYHVVNRRIEEGRVKADRGLIILVTVLVIALSLVMVAYMIVSVQNS